MCACYLAFVLNHLISRRSENRTYVNMKTLNRKGKKNYVMVFCHVWPRHNFILLQELNKKSKLIISDHISLCDKRFVER